MRLSPFKAFPALLALAPQQLMPVIRELVIGLAVGHHHHEWSVEQHDGIWSVRWNTAPPCYEAGLLPLLARFGPDRESVANMFDHFMWGTVVESGEFFDPSIIWGTRVGTELLARPPSTSYNTLFPSDDLDMFVAQSEDPFEGGPVALSARVAGLYHRFTTSGDREVCVALHPEATRFFAGRVAAGDLDPELAATRHILDVHAPTIERLAFSVLSQPSYTGPDMDAFLEGGGSIADWLSQVGSTPHYLMHPRAAESALRGMPRTEKMPAQWHEIAYGGPSDFSATRVRPPGPLVERALEAIADRQNWERTFGGAS